MKEWDIDNYSNEMEKALDVLSKEFSGIRTGRASVGFLDPIKVNVYGSMTPLPHISTISSPEARLLMIQVWDKNLVKSVEKAISESNLGLTPSVEGQNIRISVPQLTEQRRVDLSKLASKYAEESRIRMRGIRRDAMDQLKRMEKDSEISEDDEKRYAEEVQKLTDSYIKKIDVNLENKKKDIMTV